MVECFGFIALGQPTAAAEIEPFTGAVAQAFTTGMLVLQVFQLACGVPNGAWTLKGQPPIPVPKPK